MTKTNTPTDKTPNKVSLTITLSAAIHSDLVVKSAEQQVRTRKVVSMSSYIEESLDQRWKREKRLVETMSETPTATIQEATPEAPQAGVSP